MFTEVELKYPVKDFSGIRKNLQQAGALLICKATEEANTVYDFPDRSLKGSGTLLRLRDFGGDVILTVKEPGQPGAMKIRKEHETLLSISFSQAEEMLCALGYAHVFQYAKTREIWSLGEDTHICLDSLSFGKYVEIESDSELKVTRASRILGLNPRKGLSKSYRHLQLLHDSTGN